MLMFASGHNCTILKDILTANNTSHNLQLLTTIILLTETLRNTLDDNEFACGVVVDLQRAFDTAK